MAPRGSSASAQGAPAGRIALFLGVSAALIAAAILFGQAGGWTSAEGGDRAGVEQARPTAEVEARLGRAKAELTASARRFLTAFLRYEVGELTPGVRRGLRATSAPEFGRQLLSSPPRRPTAGAFPPRAELRKLNVTFLTSEATLAVVDGTAIRAGFAEEFGFVFTRDATGWLASGASR